MRPSFERRNLALALKKAVSSMESGFIINTRFGDVSFHDMDAQAIAGFVRALLEAKLVARRARSRKRGPIGALTGSMVEHEEQLRRNTERASGAAHEVGARDPLATGTWVWSPCREAWRQSAGSLKLRSHPEQR